MVDLSVCIEMVYDDDPFHERIHRTAAAGVDAVEFWDWREKDVNAIEAAAEEAGVDVVGCVADGVLTDPEAADDAVETIRGSIRTADERGIPTLIVTAGPDQEGLSRETQRENVVDVLSRVVDDAADAGVTLVLEPLNTAVDHPDTFLTDSDEGFAVVDAVDSSNLELLYDVYHQQVTEGNVIRTLTENIDRVGHVHVADVPGRHEPGTGELNYTNVFAALDDVGYDGYVGCEFSPTGDPDDALNNVLDMTEGR